MKNLRKFIVLTVMFCLAAGAASADNKPVDAANLPQTAKSFISENFGNAVVSNATMDEDSRRDRYDVMLSNGIKIEFGSCIFTR